MFVQYYSLPAKEAQRFAVLLRSHRIEYTIERDDWTTFKVLTNDSELTQRLKDRASGEKGRF